MKKIKLAIIVLIIMCFILVSIIFIMNKNSIFQKNFSKDTNSKIELVKSIAKSNIYFPFEDNNKQYILLGYRISSYSDLEKSSMKIQSINYENGDLIIELDINEVPQVYNDPEWTFYDDYSIDILYDIIETRSEYNNVYISVNQDLNGGLVERFSGGIINENGKYGYIDENMNVTIPAIYNGIYDLTITNQFLKNDVGEKFEADYSNYVRISNDNGNGIANKQGKILMECQYGNIIYYGYNTFVVTKEVDNNWKMGVVDINNNIVIDFIDGFISQSYFTSTQYAIYSIINENRRYEGVIDRDFNIVLQPIYSDVSMKNIDISNSDGIYKEEYFDINDKYHEDYFVVEKDNQRAVMGTEGDIKIDYCDLSVYELSNQYEKAVRESLKK